MSNLPGGEGPALPFPIFHYGSNVDQYMLYDIHIIGWLRREQRILGCLTGTLPQVPQQNVFLGLPLELMPEEAKLLTERGFAFIVDDTIRHSGLSATKGAGEDSYRAMIQAKNQEAAEEAGRKRQASKEHAMRIRPQLGSREDTPENTAMRITEGENDDLIFSDAARNSNKSVKKGTNLVDSWHSTPTTSDLLFAKPNSEISKLAIKVSSSSFAVFQNLYDQGYYLSPGLRFGCQFMAYPGDPLRYHSHFLAKGAAWDEEIELLDFIGGGRLGTGVKKSYLLGGNQPVKGKDPVHRAFCIEWGGL